MTAILVAGIGNIFKGDDAFGTEVAQRLAVRPQPDGVKVVDFGIRGIDLAYALLDGYDAAILIDTARRGELPGTVSVVAPEAPSSEPLGPHDLVLELHALDPAKVLKVVAAMGGECRNILLVACEPVTFGDEDTGAMGLSPQVAAAVDAAIPVIERLVRELLAEDPRRSMCIEHHNMTGEVQ